MADAVIPSWLEPLRTALSAVRAEDVSRFVPPDEGGRASAVLALFGEGSNGPDLLLIERAADMRSHAGQPAFPGGASDPGESAVETALREAQEETGLDPSGVTVFGALPALWLPPSGFVVTTVLGWWHEPCAVSALDPAEVAAVARVPIAELADPANRVRVGQRTGWNGPAFRVHGLLVWGFTGGLVDRLVHFGGWEQPWEPAPWLPWPGAPRDDGDPSDAEG